MKHTFRIAMAIIAIFVTGNALAQSPTDSTSKNAKEKKELVISNHGIFIKHSVDSTGKKKVHEMDKTEDKRFSSTLGLDLGFNMLGDNSNYNDPDVKNYLKVPAAQQNSHLFDLRQSKSINVNINCYESFRLLKTPGQQIYLSSGLGLQLYNFRYENNISYLKGKGGVVEDTINFTKNKLGMDYLNVPLLFTFKTRIYQNEKNHKHDGWLVYGAGITGGFGISDWTKQKSSALGKVKVHDDFAFAGFNSCLTGEIGLDDVIRFYASYQLTNMYSGVGLVMHPFCIGFKISGI